MNITLEHVKAWQGLADSIGEHNRAAPHWKLEQCESCNFFECCVELDNLRTPITENGVIVDYKPGCKYYERARK